MLTHLTPAEVEALTNAKAARRQVVALLALGMPFRVAGGVVYVDRAVAAHWPQFAARQTGPRLDLVR